MGADQAMGEVGLTGWVLRVWVRRMNMGGTLTEGGKGVKPLLYYYGTTFSPPTKNQQLTGAFRPK